LRRLLPTILSVATAVVPWPTMRHDTRNTGASPQRATARPGDRPWSYRTGKGIFSTPVIGRGGAVYVGSADRRFFALSARGKRLWQLRAGGIFDAAAALEPGGRVLTIGAGDERLYRLRTARRARNRVVWTFRPTLPAAGGQQVRWWEGNVARGPDGDVYAGNTGGGAYHVGRDGRQRWAYPAGNAVWTTPAFGPDGTSYWGSLDLNVFALDREGARKWATLTLGYVVSSPALSRDGTLVVGSFDGRLHAIDSATGLERWTFQTRDHIYSSPALDEDAQGRLRSIVIASADGSVYDVAPDGTERWRYDTGDVVRSSPVIGRMPDGRGRIVYVGASDGRLYALDLATGRRRWSFDTTPKAPALRDRNDLNGSPALGPHGVVIGGEHGFVWSIPYDWCLHHRDRRCDTSAAQPFGQDLLRVLPVSSGGATLGGGAERTRSAATVVNARLIQRSGGVTIDAGMLGVPSAEALVQATPAFPFHVQLSGDRHLAYVVPDGLLAPSTAYQVRVHGLAARQTMTPLGGHVPTPQTTAFDDTIRFHTPGDGGPLPLRPNRVVELRRLSLPLPSFLTSVNQIGFDDYELLMTPLEVTADRVLAYVQTGRRDAAGRLVADPNGGLDFPIAGIHRGSTFALTRRDLTLRLEFGATPMRVFTLRGTFAPDQTVRPGASLYGEIDCATMPGYGPQLIAIGLCNAQDVLAASGTYLARAYNGPAGRPLPGLTLADVRLQRPTLLTDGSVSATLTGGSVAGHAVSIALVDPATGEPLALDELSGKTVTGDTVTLRIPARTSVPDHPRAYVIVDGYALAPRDL
jgi:outer membrane protein assembly factor BamB